MQALLDSRARSSVCSRGIASWSGWLLVVLTGHHLLRRGLPQARHSRSPSRSFRRLEWHLHTAIFSFWLGFDYTINAHPRVDSLPRDVRCARKAWIELFGLLALRAAVPPGRDRLFRPGLSSNTSYCQWRAFGGRERPAAPLGHQGSLRFSASSAAGRGVISVILRLIVFLFGGAVPAAGRT